MFVSQDFALRLQVHGHHLSYSLSLVSSRPHRASFTSKESAVRNDSVPHQLTKKLQNLKKKIKQFEEQFENERNYKVRRILQYEEQVSVEKY